MFVEVDRPGWCSPEEDCTLVLIPVSSIYIWSKNCSHSSKQKSEAKDGGNWRSYSTSVSVPLRDNCTEWHIHISAQGTETDRYWRTIAFKFPPSLASLSSTKFLLQIYMELTGWSLDAMLHQPVKLLLTGAYNNACAV